jgi:primosomal protein N' (replication factor Y)
VSGEGVEVLGPAPCPLARLRRRHRFQLLLKSAEAPPLHRAGRAIQRAASLLPRSVRVGVDAHPIQML